jgi:hypothetical protein
VAVTANQSTLQPIEKDNNEANNQQMSLKWKKITER